MDLTSALTIEGPLEKQSPSVLKVFQSRYFAIRGKGEFLVWFKKKPVNPDQNPQGIINIDTISEVTGTEDKIFYIQYLSRKFTLKAQSQAVKQRWVQSLKTIIAYHRKLNKNRKKQLENTNQSWKWNNISNKEISEQIRLENQQMLQEGDQAKGNLNQIMLNHLLKDKAHEPDLEKCLVSGFYQKKGTLTSSNRWFFLISQINLFDDNDEQLRSSIPEILSVLSNQQQQQKAEKTKPVQEKKRRRKVSSSSDSEAQKQKLKQKQKKSSNQLRTNVLYQYDEQTKTLKHSYDLLHFIDYEINTSEQPFSIKIFYEEIVNQEEQQIKQIEIVITNNFLIEIRKLYHALQVIFEKFSITKQRQKMLNSRSKRYQIRKWKYQADQSWMVPEKSSDFFGLLINRTKIKINAIQIQIQNIQDHKNQSFKSAIAQQKQSQGYLIKYKFTDENQNKQTKKLCLIFKDKQIQKKFAKKLTKNYKKIQGQNSKNTKKPQVAIEEPKKVNPDTYLIDKKVRQTQNSIKVNFYDLMDREITTEKNEGGDKNKNGGFFNMISSFFCATGSSLDAD